MDIVNGVKKQFYQFSDAQLLKLKAFIDTEIDEEVKRRKGLNSIQWIEELIEAVRSHYGEIDYGYGDWKSEKVRDAVSELKKLDFDRIVREISKLDDIQSKFLMSVKYIQLMAWVISDTAEGPGHKRVTGFGGFCETTGNELDLYFEIIVDDCLKEGYLPSKEELEKLSDCLRELDCYAENFEVNLRRLKDSIKEQNKSASNNGEPPAKKAKKNID